MTKKLIKILSDIFLPILIIYLISQLSLDFLQKINTNFNFNLPKLHRYLKAIFLGYLSIYTILNKNKINKNLLFSSLSLILIFLFSNNYTENRIEFFLQYLFFLFIILAFLNYRENINKIHIVLKIFLLINFIIVIIGFIFKVKIFSTYGLQRFGFNGLIITPMQTTILYISSLIISIKKRDVIFIIIIIISSFLAGTKALLLGIPLSLFLLWLFDKQSVKIKYLMFLGTAFLGLGGYILTTPTFKSLIATKGYTSAIFSYRNDLLLNSINIIFEKFSLKNFLFGTYDLAKLRCEFDLIDIFFFFGIIGVLIFLFIFYIIYKKLGINPHSKSYFFVMLFISFFSGNVIAYPFNAFLFLLTLLLLNNKNLLRKDSV